jgi:4-diphosphocytidyl-2-C-methyl-D-erythritol kinase
MLNKFKLPAFAKINLYLEILGKRDDGFHELNTIFQTISLCDYLTFEASDELILTCDVESVPTDESNLIIKAANALIERFNVKKGAKMHLQKITPSPGGLGGGSSDCAVALLGLAKLWNLEIKFERNLVLMFHSFFTAERHSELVAGLTSKRCKILKTQSFC